MIYSLRINIFLSTSLTLDKYKRMNETKNLKHSPRRCFKVDSSTCSRIRSSHPFPPCHTRPTWWLRIGRLHTKQIAVMLLKSKYPQIRWYISIMGKYNELNVKGCNVSTIDFQTWNPGHANRAFVKWHSMIEVVVFLRYPLRGFSRITFMLDRVTRSASPATRKGERTKMKRNRVHFSSKLLRYYSKSWIGEVDGIYQHW